MPRGNGWNPTTEPISLCLTVSNTSSRLRGARGYQWAGVHRLNPPVVVPGDSVLEGLRLTGRRPGVNTLENLMVSLPRRRTGARHPELLRELSDAHPTSIPVAVGDCIKSGGVSTTGNTLRRCLLRGSIGGKRSDGVSNLGGNAARRARPGTRLI